MVHEQISKTSLNKDMATTEKDMKKRAKDMGMAFAKILGVTAVVGGVVPLLPHAHDVFVTTADEVPPHHDALVERLAAQQDRPAAFGPGDQPEGQPSGGGVPQLVLGEVLFVDMTADRYVELENAVQALSERIVTAEDREQQYLP